MTTEHTTALKHLIHRPGATCAVYASYNVLTFSGTPTTAALHQHCKITACVIPAVLNTTITALRNPAPHSTRCILARYRMLKQGFVRLTGTLKLKEILKKTS